MWYDYLKGVQNMEKYVINFFNWVENLGRDLNDQML